ncbi:MAG: dihydroorotase [Flavobacteriales bacterium]|nr:dihydroorotase [Flavobacteriales bacterium]
MSKPIVIWGATVVNEGEYFTGGVLIKDGRIAEVFRESGQPEQFQSDSPEWIDASGLHLIPGAIDDQVHFREPGLTHKADIYHESRAAVAGGITSFMEMPNTVPNALTQQLLEDKYALAAEKSIANYSFYMGASNDNLEEVLKTDVTRVCGVKVFMGSSTGNMLVDNKHTLEGLFAECPTLLAAHCEDEATIRSNMALYKEKYGDALPPSAHPLIRSEEACYKSSSLAVELAAKNNTRFHLLHVSTQKELSLLEEGKPLADKRITAEACIHHLWFTDADYISKSNFIKWNPAVKKETDRDAIRMAVKSGRIDVVATDHAPHTKEEKSQPYITAPSGGPLVQFALPAMLELSGQGVYTITEVVDKMCHAPATAFRLRKRGFIRTDYQADLVLIDMNKSTDVKEEMILSKCGWSPFEGHRFPSCIARTFVNGRTVYADGQIVEGEPGERLLFDPLP